MAKVMMFVDGSWLYHSRPALRREKSDPHYAIDYGKLPRVLVGRLRQALGTDLDLVRVNFFASIPHRYSARDAELVEDQEDFYDRLKEEFHYETEIYPIDFRGQRIRADNREPFDALFAAERFNPREKQVDVGLASSMLYYAAIPGAYDAAIAVIGDEDYVPALQLVRRLGKRVMVASVRGSCDEVYLDPVDPKRIRDVDTVFLNDLLDEIQLEYEPVVVECQSDRHAGPERSFSTVYRPRPGQRIFCPDCRASYAQDRAATEAELNQAIDSSVLARVLPGYKAGRIARLMASRGYGFIRSEDGADYFFHASSLRDVEFHGLHERQYVQFVPKDEPGEFNQWRGNVREVRRLDEAS